MLMLWKIFMGPDGETGEQISEMPSEAWGAGRGQRGSSGEAGREECLKGPWLSWLFGVNGISWAKKEPGSSRERGIYTQPYLVIEKHSIPTGKLLSGFRRICLKSYMSIIHSCAFCALFYF